MLYHIFGPNLEHTHMHVEGTDMVTIVHEPKNTFKIDSVWAFISQDEDGNEGVCACNGLPLIAADPVRLDSLRPLAEKLKTMTTKKIVLIRLHAREDVEVL